MKCNITFVLIVIILCVVSCRKNEPENKLVTKFNYSPDFEYSGDLSVGNKVKFDTSGIPPNSIFKWDFGDGNTSNNAAPEHIFADRGLYIVTLSITWDTNVTIQKEVNITLLPKDFNKIRSWKGIHANGPQSDPSQTVVKDINEKSSINVISDTTCGFYYSQYLRFTTIQQPNILVFESWSPEAKLYYSIANDSMWYYFHTKYGSGQSAGFVRVDMHTE